MALNTSGGAAGEPDALAQETVVDAGPAHAILRAIVGDQIPSGELGPETVSPKVLGLPLRWAAEALVEHNKSCKAEHCSRVPQAFWPYSKWRPKAIATIEPIIHKALWTQPDHEFVAVIRRRVLSQEPHLTEQVVNGSFLSGHTLERFLLSTGTDGARKIQTILWAMKFEVPSGEWLFRILTPLVDAQPRQSLKRAPIRTTENNARDRALREAKRSKVQAEQAYEKARQELARKEKALAKVAQELSDLRLKYTTASKELDALTVRLREAETAYQLLERNSARMTKSNATLRNDLHEVSCAVTELELRRSELALQVARDRRTFEQYKLDYMTGADAVWEFLLAEEERIRVEQTITFGGDRRRADEAWKIHRKLREAFLTAHPEYIPAPPDQILPKTGLRFTALGGSGEVGRSCYLIEIGKKRLLVDCGISVGKDLVPDIGQVGKIDAILLTHAHTDHIGWIPALIQKTGDVDIYCSAATAALLPVMLDDCRRHYVRKLAKSRERALRVRNADVVTEDYADEDVRNVPNLAITCPYGEEVGLPTGGLSVRFYPAGHILGASSILIEDRIGSRRVFVSGDFSSFPQLTVPAAEWPGDLGDIDLLVLESTYGGTNHDPIDDSRQKLISIIGETVEAGGSIILAAFALGRAQELLSLIAGAREKGQLSRSVPVHTDGMINRINPIYQRLAGNFDAREWGFHEVTGQEERKEVIFEAQKGPRIIVTTSGMMNGGPVVEYAHHLLPDPRHRILFTGYQDEGAPSRGLSELARPTGGKRIVEIEDEKGETLRIEAAVPAKKVGLSAHADQAGLVKYAGSVGAEVIALVHGEPAAQEKLRAVLAAAHAQTEIICAPGQLPVR